MIWVESYYKPYRSKIIVNASGIVEHIFLFWSNITSQLEITFAKYLHVYNYSKIYYIKLIYILHKIKM